MVQSRRRTRKLRKGGGWFSSEAQKSNANLKRASNNALGKIKESNAKATVKRKAETAAAIRRDYMALDAKKDKLILERRKAASAIEDIDRQQKRMINEELKKEADKWVSTADKKPGWFS